MAVDSTTIPEIVVASVCRDAIKASDAHKLSADVEAKIRVFGLNDSELNEQTEEEKGYPAIGIVWRPSYTTDKPRGQRLEVIADITCATHFPADTRQTQLVELYGKVRAVFDTYSFVAGFADSAFQWHACEVAEPGDATIDGNEQAITFPVKFKITRR